MQGEPECLETLSATLRNEASRAESRIIYGVLLLFSSLLALVTFHHAITLDEAQAWLIARDSHGLFDLCRHLRYEGHPAAWYLLLYLPAHLSGNVGWMQAINCLLAILLAWLILSERRIDLVVRVLLVFSPFIFFYLGVTARSYALASVLLVAAARFFRYGRRYDWLGVLALALAINTHFLAIPLAIGEFFWLFCAGPDQTFRDALAKFRVRRSWLLASVLVAAIGLCYLTLHPAPDVYTPQYDRFGASPGSYVLLGVAQLWQYVVPLSQMLEPALPHSWMAASLSVGLWLVALLFLPSQRSRGFMITTSLLWITAVWATVRVPSALHTSLLFIAFVVSLTMTSPGVTTRTFLSARHTKPILLLILGIQVLACFILSTVDAAWPISETKAAADWIKTAGLSTRPLVIEPDFAAPPILAYTGIDSAYFPACRCRGSFIVFRKTREVERRITSGELDELHHQYGSPPIVITKWPLIDADRKQLGLRLLHVTPHAVRSIGGDVLVYGRESDSSALRSEGQ
jgi:hypothetical protein